MALKQKCEFDSEATEQQIISLLQDGPMLQKDIISALPTRIYMQAGNLIRDMERRGVIHREKYSSTRLVTLTRK